MKLHNEDNENINIKLNSNNEQPTNLNSNITNWDSIKKLKTVTQNLNLVGIKNQSGKNTQNLENYSNLHNSTKNTENLQLKQQQNNQYSNNKYYNNYFDEHEQTNTSNSTNNSTLELNQQLENLKILYEKKVLDIDNLYQDLNTKDKIIGDLTNYISKQLEQNQVPIVQISTSNSLNFNTTHIESEVDHNNNSYINNESDIDKKLREKENEIEYLNQEILNLKLLHERRKQDLINDFDENLNNYLEDIQDEYKIRLQEFTSDHEKIIKGLKEQIIALKSTLDEFDNKHVKKFEHNEVLYAMKKEQDKELKGYEKEIEKLEIGLKEKELEQMHGQPIYDNKNTINLKDNFNDNSHLNNNFNDESLIGSSNIKMPNENCFSNNNDNMHIDIQEMQDIDKYMLSLVEERPVTIDTHISIPNISVDAAPKMKYLATTSNIKSSDIVIYLDEDDLAANAKNLTSVPNNEFIDDNEQENYVEYTDNDNFEDEDEFEINDESVIHTIHNIIPHPKKFTNNNNDIFY